MKCTIMDDYQNVALKFADWNSLSSHLEIQVLNQPVKDESALVNLLGDSSIIVAMRERTVFDRSLLEKLPNLKLLVTSGMRNSAIDLSAAKDLGIKVCGTKSSSTPPVELTWALILALSRHIPEEVKAFRDSGPWQSTVGRDLFGKTLGIIGLGKIGSKVAAIASAFEMNVLAWSPNLTQEACQKQGVTLAASKDSLLKESDIVSIHLVLGERSRGLIQANDLSKMKSSALLINTSRAAIVDSTALFQALKTGSIAGAGVDVYDVEPVPVNDPVRSLPNLIATPHLGYVTEMNYKGYFQEAVEDIKAYLDGSLLREIQGK